MFFSRKSKKSIEQVHNNSRLRKYEEKFPNIPREKLAELESTIHNDYERKMETLTICMNDMSKENDKIKRENQAILKILKSKEDLLMEMHMNLLEFEARSSDYLRKLEDASLQLEKCIEENEKLTRDVVIHKSLEIANSMDKMKIALNESKSDATAEGKKEDTMTQTERKRDQEEIEYLSKDTSDSEEDFGDPQLNKEYEELLIHFRDQQKHPLFNLMKKLKVHVETKRKELFDRNEDLDTAMHTIEKNEKKLTKVVEYYKKILAKEKTEREEAEKKSLALKKKVITLEYILERVDSDSEYESDQEEDG